MEEGKLHVGITGDNGEYIKSVEESIKVTEQFEKKAEQLGETLSNGGKVNWHIFDQLDSTALDDVMAKFEGFTKANYIEQLNKAIAEGTQKGDELFINYKKVTDSIKAVDDAMKDTSASETRKAELQSLMDVLIEAKGVLNDYNKAALEGVDLVIMRMT